MKIKKMFYKKNEKASELILEFINYFENDQNEVALFLIISILLREKLVEEIYIEKSKMELFSRKKIETYKTIYFVQFYEEIINPHIEKNLVEIKEEFSNILESRNLIESYEDLCWIISQKML